MVENQYTRATCRDNSTKSEDKASFPLADGKINANHSLFQAPPPSAYTASYDAPGYFTGVRSEVTIDRPPAVVYNSLASNLQLVFSPISVRT